MLKKKKKKKQDPLGWIVGVHARTDDHANDSIPERIRAYRVSSRSRAVCLNLPLLPPAPPFPVNFVQVPVAIPTCESAAARSFFKENRTNGRTDGRTYRVASVNLSLSLAIDGRDEDVGRGGGGEDRMIEKTGKKHKLNTRAREGRPTGII